MNVACNSKVSIHAVMRRLSTKQQPNFPVVLFRSDFMLLSEKNCMKVCENQWVLTIPYPPKYLSRATSRGQTMVPEAQKPSQWLCLTKLPREMCSQLIASKALSWGTIRKSACILAAITIRNSQTYTRKKLGSNLFQLLPFQIKLLRARWCQLQRMDPKQPLLLGIQSLSIW